MKITCEFCGTAIDTSKYQQCPECDGTYENNKMYLKQQEIELEKKRLDNERTALKLKKEKTTAKSKEKENKQKNLLIVMFCLIMFFMFVLPIIVGVGLGIYEVIIGEDIDLKHIEEYTYATGNYNEWVDNKLYAIKIDEIKEIDRYPFQPSDGYMYVAIHFSLKNTGNKNTQVWEDRVDVIVNGYAQKRSWDSTLKEISSDFIAPEIMIDGYEVFEIPKTQNTIVIKYGDYITINCDSNNITHLNVPAK